MEQILLIIDLCSVIVLEMVHAMQTTHNYQWYHDFPKTNLWTNVGSWRKGCFTHIIRYQSDECITGRREKTEVVQISALNNISLCNTPDIID